MFIGDTSALARPRSDCTRHREFPRRDDFRHRDSNDVEFAKNIAKSVTDRCRSRLKLKMSNATLYKHFARRKCRFFTFTKRISCRTMNSSIPCISKRFSRLLRTDLPLRSCIFNASNSRYRSPNFRTVTRLDDLTQR